MSPLSGTSHTRPSLLWCTITKPASMNDYQASLRLAMNGLERLMLIWSGQLIDMPLWQLHVSTHQTKLSVYGSCTNKFSKGILRPQILGYVRLQLECKQIAITVSSLRATSVSSPAGNATLHLCYSSQSTSCSFYEKNMTMYQKYNPCNEVADPINYIIGQETWVSLWSSAAHSPWQT